MLEFSFLTEAFYSDYIECSEIEQKPKRPYIRIKIEIDGVVYAIPLRSNISHPNVLWTDKENKCGVDFSKAVIINNESKYINADTKPKLRQCEFDSLRGKEHIIKTKMKKYISDYKKAKQKPEIPRHELILKYSTLQYFEDSI